MEALEVNVTLPPEQKVVGPPAVIVGVGLLLTVTAVADEVALQPFPSVIVTVYDPPALTVIPCVVWPDDHK